MPRKYNMDRDRLRTPINILNLANCGGYQFGGICEAAGRSKSGKSTFAYQCAEYLLEDYKEDAMVLILDAENATKNSLRLREAFGIDIRKDPRIKVEPAFTIEAANDHISRYSNLAKENDKYLLIIWDSITASSFTRAKEAIDKSLEKEEQAERGMTEPMARAQVMKWCLNNALHTIYCAPVFIILINQATTKVNQFNTSVKSSGGFAVEHNADERLWFNYLKKVSGANEFMNAGTMSEVTVEKSRSTPSFQNIPIYIDDSVGGRIVTEREISMLAPKLGVLKTKSGGWYYVAEELVPPNAPEKFTKSRQLVDVFNDPEYVDFINRSTVDFLRKEYKLIDCLYREMESVDLETPTPTVAPKPAAKSPAKAKPVKK